jgi:hypothetical protein
MPDDLSHIDRQIQKNEIDAAEHRKRADVAQATAASKQGQGTGTEGTYFEQEAYRERQKADALDADTERMKAAKADAETKLASLKQQRESEVRDHEAKIAALDREIKQVAGTSLSL